MKKILSLILAGLMTVSCAAFVAADDAAVEATSDPAQDAAIEFLAEYKIFKGGEGLTNEDLIQRYQMALFVSRISTGWVEDDVWEDGSANDSTFDDIGEEPASKYLGALSYANQNGIIEGYSKTKFGPYDTITYRDALTMVVRTLGYKGLSYPWGNIEKAVELGLTEGVDAAYTDELTRGEVALIIYNALFADTAKGGTLAKAIFDVDFAWKNIIIVSTDEYTLVENADGKAYAPAAQGGETYVGFKTIDEDGTIGDKVYFVKAKELGLTGHEEELAVGSIYVALFEAIDGNYVTIKKADKGLITKTVANNGVTDNTGKAYETMPIAAELAKYQLVKNYTNGVVSYEYDDLKVYGYGAYTTYGKNDELVGIQFDTHDIVKKVTKEDGTTEWVAEWFYNSELQKYYKYEIAADKVFVNWMSEPEFIEWYNEAVKVKLNDYYQLKLLDSAMDVMEKGLNPYSKLDLYNIDDEADYEIANYKSYQIGQISLNKTDYKCAACNNAVKPAYVLQGLDGAGKDWVFVEEGHTNHDTDLTKGFGWLNVSEDVTTFDPAVGGVVLYNWNKTTGEIEIVKHITSGENDDEDSAIITGVLQAYSTKNQTVTIDGKVYPIDYDRLAGDIYAINEDINETVRRKLIADDLDDQYMQYITAVVCDGYVVDTDLRDSSSAAIVVLGYAGVTADGYIAVYGYRTDDLSLKVFKINTYNGWKKGDYRYNPANADNDDAFDFGALYTIRSYDAETDSYGVYTENIDTVLDNAVPVRVTFKNGYRSVQPMSLIRDNGRYTWEVKEDKDGNDVVPTVVAMTAADKYVIVSNNHANMASSNIYVYDGEIVANENAYAIDAMMVGNLDSKTLVLYTLDNLNDIASLGLTGLRTGIGFTDNAYDVGYVVYEKGNGKVLDAAYDEALRDIVGDSYLLGSTMSEVTVFNLLKGERDTVIASSNIDLINGHIYKTIGGQILWDVTDDCDAGHNFLSMLVGAYTSRDLDYADYIIEPAVTLRKEDLTKLNLAFELGLLNITDIDNADGTDKAIANKLIHDEFAKRIYVVTDAWTWDWYEHNSNIELTSLAALADNTTYTADLVYEVATGKVVIYIFDDEAGNNIVVDNDTKEYTGKLYENVDNTGAIDTADYQPKWTLKVDGKDHHFDVEVTYTVEGEFNNVPECMGDLVGLKLTSLKVAVVEMTKGTDGKWTAASVADCTGNEILHDLLAAEGYCFGGVNIDAADFVNALTVEGNAVPVDEDDITVKSMTDCGLVTEITFDLTDVNAEMNIFTKTNFIVDTMSIDVDFDLYPEFNDGTVDTFLGIDNEESEVDLSGSLTVNIPLGAADEDNSIIVLG